MRFNNPKEVNWSKRFELPAECLNVKCRVMGNVPPTEVFAGVVRIVSESVEDIVRIGSAHG